MPQMTPQERAFLEAVSGPESAGKYDVIYGGQRFDDYSDHPGQYVPIRSGPNKGKKSSAAGKYQFLESTWDEIARQEGLPDFSPESQDLGALALARRDYKAKTGGDLGAALNAGNIGDVASALSGTWTSLPSGIEQGTNKTSFTNSYNAALNNAPAAKPAKTALGRLSQLFDQGSGAARQAGSNFMNAFAETAQRPQVRQAAKTVWLNTPISSDPGSRTKPRPHLTSAPDRALQFIMTRPDIPEEKRRVFDSSINRWVRKQSPTQPSRRSRATSLLS